MTANKTDCRIYVACLASYNNGKLHGCWIDADQTEEEIWAEVRAMLRDSPYPNVHVDCPDCLGPVDTKEWVENGEKLCETCAGRGKVPSAEEWAIHDQEGFAGALSESTSFEDVAALAKAIEEHGEVFAHFYKDSSSGTDVESAVDDFQDKYQGEWDSLEAYVENLWDDQGYKGDENTWWHPSNYVDWERMAHDLQTSGDITTIELDGKVHVFNNN